MPGLDTAREDPAGIAAGGNAGPMRVSEGHHRAIETVIETQGAIEKQSGQQTERLSVDASKGLACQQPGGRSYAFAFLLFVMVLLTPTGFREPLLFWNLAVLLAGAYVCGQLLQGRWPFPRLDALGGLLLGASVIACLQLLFADLDAAFFVWSALLFWAGSYLLVLLARDALAWAGGSTWGINSASRQGHWQTALAAGLALLFGAALLSGHFADYAPPLAALLRRSAGGALAEQPVWWPFLYRNHLAALVVLCLPWLLWQVMGFWTPRGGGIWLAGFSGIAAVAGLASLLASGSRSGLLMVAVEIFVCVALFFRQGLLAWRSGRRLLVAGGLLTLLLLLAGGVGGRTTIEYRMRAHGPLLEGRIDYWRASVEMIRERPFGGWGFGAWPDVYRQFQLRDNGLRVNRAHSDWLEWTADGGIWMAFLLAALLVGALRRAWCYPWALGLPMLLVAGMGDYSLRQPLVWMGFLVLWVAVDEAAAQEEWKVA
jgi:hypothetical protein